MSSTTKHKRIGFHSSEQGLKDIEKHTLQLMGWLRDDYHDVVLIANKESEIYLKAQSNNIECIDLPGSRGSFSINLARTIAKAIKEKHIEMLAVIRPRDILVYSFIKYFLFRKLKLIFIQQAPFYLKNQPNLYRILFKPFNAWVCPTPNILKKNHKLTQFNKLKMRVIPPGIDSEFITTDTLSKSSARKILKLSNKSFIVGTTGICNPEFRADFLVRMVQFLKRHNHHIELAIAGTVTNDDENEYMCFLKELAIECNVEKQVHIMPYNNKLITFLRALDVFVMNQSTNQITLLTLKAMAAGTTVMASYSEYNTSLLDKGKYGVLYKNNDLEDISAKIIHLLTQPIIHTHLRSIAKEQIQNSYDRKVIIKEYNKLFDYVSEL